MMQNMGGMGMDGFGMGGFGSNFIQSFDDDFFQGGFGNMGGG